MFEGIKIVGIKLIDHFNVSNAKAAYNIKIYEESLSKSATKKKNAKVIGWLPTKLIYVFDMVGNCIKRKLQTNGKKWKRYTCLYRDKEQIYFW